jgi:hypothetical protein
MMDGRVGDNASFGGGGDVVHSGRIRASTGHPDSTSASHAEC